MNYFYIEVAFCLILIYQFITKIIYNFINKKTPISYDKWTQMDTLVAILNLLTFGFFQFADPSFLLLESVQYFLSYFLIGIIVINWMRITVYFLLVKPIASLILILQTVIMSTVYYMLVYILYLVAISLFFTILFQNANPDAYGSLELSLITLFDAGLAVYT